MFSSDDNEYDKHDLILTSRNGSWMEPFLDVRIISGHAFNYDSQYQSQPWRGCCARSWHLSTDLLNGRQHKQFCTCVYIWWVCVHYMLFSTVNKNVSFTLYPIHNRVGRGNLVLRHSVTHFLLNSGGIAYWVAELNAAFNLDTRAKKWKYTFK